MNLNYSKKGYDAEVTAVDILKQEGFEIVFARELLIREYGSKSHKTYQRKHQQYLKVIGERMLPRYKEIEFSRETNPKIVDEHFEHTDPGDILCKKKGRYYLFEIKYKEFKKNANLNEFSSTNISVLNYDMLTRERRVKVMVMIILEKENAQMFYKIYDWYDFLYPAKFNPEKPTKPKIRLKQGFNVEKLRLFSELN